jgi:hypothetical protein
MGAGAMLRIAIVEDEEIFARELEEYVRRYAAETFREVKITHFSDGEEIAFTWEFSNAQPEVNS